jgi:hypothetical protein
MLKAEKAAWRGNDSRLLQPLGFVMLNQAVVQNVFGERIFDGQNVSLRLVALPNAHHEKRFRCFALLKKPCVFEGMLSVNRLSNAPDILLERHRCCRN